VRGLFLSKIYVDTISVKDYSEGLINCEGAFMVVIEVSAGLLIRKGIRGFLEDCIFKGLDISYRESKAIFSSHFIIKGSRDDISKVANSLSSYYEAK
jgi:hypothetical protein